MTFRSYFIFVSCTLRTEISIPTKSQRRCMELRSGDLVGHLNAENSWLHQPIRQIFDLCYAWLSCWKGTQFLGRLRNLNKGPKYMTRKHFTTIKSPPAHQPGPFLKRQDGFIHFRRSSQILIFLSLFNCSLIAVLLQYNDCFFCIPPF